MRGRIAQRAHGGQPGDGLFAIIGFQVLRLVQDHDRVRRLDELDGLHARLAHLIDDINSPRARVLALSESNLKKLDDFPFQELLGMLAGAATQAQLGQAIGVPQPTVSLWLHGLRGERAEQVEAARAAAGLACLDKGLAELEAARGGDAAAVGLARALDQHWSRRAGLYNRKLSDKGELINAPQNQQITPPSFRICIISKDNQSVTIDQVPDDLI